MTRAQFPHSIVEIPVAQTTMNRDRTHLRRRTSGASLTFQSARRSAYVSVGFESQGKG